MTAYPHYAEREADAPLVTQAADDAPAPAPAPHQFDDMRWAEQRDEQRGAGGRQVLRAALALLAALWLGYAAWSAGRALSAVALDSPALAQWVAIVAGPLALLGLVWLTFGRTRRKEAEQFTRSVIAMRTEARALEDVLAALSRQIEHNHGALGQMAGSLMGLGDETAQRLAAATADLSRGAHDLVAQADLFDRAAGNARTDLGVMMSDLPLAEQKATAMAEALRGAGRHSVEQAAAFTAAVEALGARTARTDEAIGQSVSRLAEHLAEVENAGAAAAQRITEASDVTNAGIDTLLNRAADTLSQIRGGIDAQAASVTALLDQAHVALGRAGVEAGHALSRQIDGAGASLDVLTGRIGEQERASQRLVADLDRGLAALDERFERLAEQGDERAGRLSGHVGRLRADLVALGDDTGAQDQALLALNDRTVALRDGVTALSLAVAHELNGAFGEAEAGAARLLAASDQARPSIEWMQDAAGSTAERLLAGQQAVESSEAKLAALLGAVDGGVAAAQARLAELNGAIAGANDDAIRLANETGPALIAALAQVREAGSHAAERARAAIAAIVPESAAQLGDAARAALETAVREAVEERLAEVDRVATKAVESARQASDRLTQQMLSIGQSAVALEAHLERSREAQRKDDGEDFARRVSLLMDSMHSAAIDVQKILSDDVDEKAWGAYLKGNRGVFTRRAVRLIAGTETRAIASHYDSDPEFQQSVNRYVHDFEAMLRRVLAERDGGMMAVTLMSGDMGKLYAALAQGIDRRR